MKGGAYPVLSLHYPSLSRKRYPFTAGLTERVFQSSHGEAQARTQRLSALQPSQFSASQSLYWLIFCLFSVLLRPWYKATVMFEWSINRYHIISVRAQTSEAVNQYAVPKRSPVTDNNPSWSNGRGKRP